MGPNIKICGKVREIIRRIALIQIAGIQREAVRRFILPEKGVVAGFQEDGEPNPNWTPNCVDLGGLVYAHHPRANACISGKNIAEWSNESCKDDL